MFISGLVNDLGGLQAGKKSIKSPSQTWKMKLQQMSYVKVQLPRIWPCQVIQVTRPIANRISRLVMANWKCAMAGY